MDDNIWEYPFGDLDDEDDLYDRKPASGGSVIRDNNIFTCSNIIA